MVISKKLPSEKPFFGTIESQILGLSHRIRKKGLDPESIQARSISQRSRLHEKWNGEQAQASLFKVAAILSSAAFSVLRVVATFMRR